MNICTVINYIINGVGFISAIVSLIDVFIVRKDRRIVEKYKQEIEEKMTIRYISSLAYKAAKIEKIIISYYSNSYTGRNQITDKKAFYTFISEIRQYAHFFPNNIAEEYFKVMNKAINTSDYKKMYDTHSHLCKIIKDVSLLNCIK